MELYVNLAPFPALKQAPDFSLTALDVHAVVAHVYVSTLENTTLFLLRLYVSLTMHDIVSLYSLLFKNNIICFSFGI